MSATSPADTIIHGRKLILAACMAASFMAAIEATIVATVMPAIASDLGGYGLFAWVFSAYMLAQAVTIPLFGRLADMYGRRKVFFAGVALFLLGSTLCGFARTMPLLVLFRAIQGLGAGGVQPIANTIVADIYTPVERARIQGMLSGVFGVAAIIGPSLGAFIVYYGYWPLVFWINLPIGAVAIAMIARFLPRHELSRPRRVDYLGSMLLMAAVTALMLLLVHGTGLETSSATLAVTIFVASAAILIWHERRAAEPMLPLELWRNRMVANSSLGSLITGILMMGVMAWLPAYVQGVMNHGANVSAAILAVMAVTWVLGSTAAGLCLPRSSYRRIATWGAAGLILGAAALVTLSPESGSIWIGFGAVTIGAGMGFCNTTYMVSAQTSVAWHQRGAATSSIMFLRFLGQALGAAAFGAVLNVSLAGAAHSFDQIMDPAFRARLSAGDLDRSIGLIAVAMRHGYLLVGAMALLALWVARRFPAKFGPSDQARLK